ncbi:MAG: DUF4834 domain-containing protein [Cyclobacteriaceae bacterium]|nr:DUF4834 domain-containing protein [Cytophagales bacterium]MBX2899688.1 DUF4834 domain-containing protein [Cyclobacteriaceae bacterium]
MRFFIIVALLGYVFYKVGTLFFKAGAASQQGRQNRRSFNGTVNADAPPKKTGKGTIKGGEYVDYEEVK